jgi:hypothetical protein
VTLATNQLWILHTIVSNQIASTRAQSLIQQLSQVRRAIEDDLRLAGEGHRLDRVLRDAA